MKIAVVGTGYVGLVTGTCLAETGNQVTCIDVDLQKVDMLRAGNIPIYEPGLDILFERNVAQKRLQFTSDLEEGVKGAQVVFLALPTPPGEDGSADLSYVLKAAADLGRLLEDYTIIIDKSTVPVGTADKVREQISRQTNVDFDVVSNPEFLREGVAVEDFMKPDRIVIGTSSEKAKAVLSELYAPYVRQGNPVIFMDTRSAELTKYAANSFLAVKISFMNEIAQLCERLDANVDMVRLGIGADARIGKRFLFPGVGYGGSCFPKDVQALARSAAATDYEFKILQAVMAVNVFQREFFVNKLLEFFGRKLDGRKIALWGLAFKPETDDIREAPAVYVIEALLELGVSLRVYDPEAMENVRSIFGDKIEYAADQYEAIQQADALAILTEWPVFRAPDFKLLRDSLKESAIFDGRNLYDPDKMEKLGFYYNSIGRKLVDGRKSK